MTLESILAVDTDAARRTVEAEIRNRMEAAGGKLVMAGAGALGRATLTAARRAGLTPVAFADNNAALAGKEIEGVPVMPSAEAAERYRDDAVFAITVYTSERMWAQYRQYGIEPVSFTQLAWAYPAAFMPYYAVEEPGMVRRAADAIRALLPLWADDASRTEYLAQLKWRTALEPTVLGGNWPAKETLFAPELIAFHDDESFVDCGAYDGDTVTQFLGLTKGRFKAISAYEPDLLNFAKLQKLVTDLPDGQRQRVRLYPNALGSAPGRIQFDASGTVASAGGTGERWVDVVTLDETADVLEPTFIKMDIEGAEPDAIRGAAKIIERHKPILAVCLYHVGRHLWEIPLMLAELAPRHRLYLRRYSNDCWEQVCYAIPEHRAIVP